MKFLFCSEAEALPGSTYQVRYKELIEQVIHAENWGFDTFGVSEQQYAIGGVATACPEVLYGYLFPITKKIRFAHIITLIPKPINHPLRIASRTAVQDILSDGRIELGLGRGNTTLALRAFEVDMGTSRDQLDEGVQIIKKAFTEDPFMFYGEHYKIPPRSLVPKVIQQPHPPIYLAATSPDSHEIAGRQGVGTVTWSNHMGWDYLAESIGVFRKASEKTAAAGEQVNSNAIALTVAYCAESDEAAEADAGDRYIEYLKVAANAYPRLAKMAKSYAYMKEVSEKVEGKDTLEYLTDHSASAVFGSPETCIRQIEQFRECGVDQVILRVDGVPHEKIMKSIELFGRYVIPHFKNARDFMRPAEDVMADIRTMREQAKAQGTYVELESPRPVKDEQPDTPQAAE